MDLPGFRLHSLKGQMKEFWSVTVRANWRVIFRFAKQAAEKDFRSLLAVDYFIICDRPLGIAYL
jgi:plasmid maintenance system killer protein